MVPLRQELDDLLPNLVIVFDAFKCSQNLKVGIHFVHRLRGQKAHDYHVTEYAAAHIRAPIWNYAGTGSAQATHASM